MQGRRPGCTTLGGGGAGGLSQIGWAHLVEQPGCPDSWQDLLTCRERAWMARAAPQAP